MAARWTMAGRQLLSLLLLLSAVQAKVVDGFDWVIGGADGDVWMRFKTIWETRSTALGDEGGKSVLQEMKTTKATTHFLAHTVQWLCSCSMEVI